MRKLNTILFDLDGTLINTNEIIIRSFVSTFERHFPKIEVSRDKLLTYIGPSLSQTFAEYTNDLFLIQDMINTFREFYVDYEVGNFEIYPNVERVIKRLHEEGYNLGIVTSKFTISAWPSFTFYNLDKYFQVFVGLGHVTNPKPDKEPVLTALSQFENVDKAIMIGDNQGDILSGKNAGIYSAGVAWSIKGSAHLMEVEPDYMLGSIEDIFTIIQKLEEN